MAAKQKNTTLVITLLVLATAAFWSTKDSLRVFLAAMQAPAYTRAALANQGQLRLEDKRRLQKHFLDYGVYVPLEDIMYVDQLTGGADRFEMAIDRSCGGGPLAVWLPLRVELPLFGEKVLEWCWKPIIRR